MEGLQECPVCTLFLREGISLRQHLETHPKEQVIDALLRERNHPEQHTAVAAPQTHSYLPTLQPAPQLTTAVTYQQILTTNAAGAVVPQFMQVPAFVNSSFGVSQNFPNFFQPVVNPYVSQPYVISNDSTITTTAPTREGTQEEETVLREMTTEMDLEEPEPQEESVNPPMQSVIISRPTSNSSFSQSHTPSPPPLEASPNIGVGRETYKHEDTVIVETPTAFHSRECSSPEPPQVEMYKIDKRPDAVSSQNLANSSFEDKCNPQEMFSPEPEVPTLKELKQNVAELEVYTASVAVAEENSSPVYADLVPAQNHSENSTTQKILQGLTNDIASSSNTTFMELDGIRIFFNGSVLSSAPRTPSPAKACSVIQLADSTKPDPQEVKDIKVLSEMLDVKEMSLNIIADESMPARGELSEQESLGADSAWGLFHQDVKPWPKPYKCATCEMSFDCPKERRVHKNLIHPKPRKVLRCNLCSAVFSTLRARRSHMEEHAAAAVKTEVKEEPTSSGRHCPECPTIACSLKDLRGHMREAHGFVRYRCQTCEATFDEERNFNEHLKEHPLKCSQCDKTFLRRANLNLHRKRHLLVKPFECDLCPKSFITRQKLEEHTNGHAGVKPIKCLECPKTFSRHSNLIQHRNIHHAKPKKKVRDYVCRCGEIFHSQRKLDWHKEIHDNKPKSCPFCAQKFIHVASVTRHVRRSHLPDYLPEGNSRDLENVSCPICDRIYLRSSLPVHMRVHSGERPFQCSVCSKQFTTKWNMELHQWTHQSRAQMPYKCSLCKSAFFRETDYVAHVNAHKNLKPFICNVCGQKFIRKYNCLRHQSEHRKAKRFACTVAGCGRVFHRSYYLKDHMKVHTGVRPHTCHICGKASTTKSNHNKHLRIHDTREPINTEN